MDPYSRNGSFIGQTMNFGATDRYIIGYVGATPIYGNYKNSGIWDLQTVYNTKAA